MSADVAADRPWTADEEPPLSARSVVASTLLGTRPPRLPTRRLVAACGLFGIAEGTARVAISRMVASGELAPGDHGYALAGPLLDRSTRQELSATAPTRPWRADRDGWALAVVTAEARTAQDRAALRRAATALRLAERREGVWLRPDNLPVGALPEAEAVVGAQCERFTARPEGDPAGLAASLWDLDGWAARAGRLEDALARSLPALGRQEAGVLPEAFVLSAAVLRHLQGDPLLPEELLAPAWPGDRLRDAHRRWRRAFDATWVAWVGADGEA